MEDGVWRTIGGRRVFIRTGQSLGDAMKESGKFKLKSNTKEVDYTKVNVSAKEREELINYYLDNWKERMEKDSFYKTRFGEKYEQYLKEKETGFKDREYDLTKIEDCKDMLKDINWLVDNENGMFDRMDVNLRAEAVKQIYDITRNSPALLEETLTNYSMLKCERIYDDTVAYTQFGSITLNINDYYSKDRLKESFNNNFKEGWTPPVAPGNETKHYITHELGHLQVDRTYSSLKQYFQNAIENGEVTWDKRSLDKLPSSLKNIKEVKEVISKPDDYSGNNKRIEKMLIEEPIRRVMKKEGLSRKEVIDKYSSGYGKEKGELFPEMFANGLLGKPNSLGFEVINFLDEIGGYKK